MSKDLNTRPLANSLIRLYLIEDIRSDRQIVPKNIKLFRVSSCIFILNNIVRTVSNRLRSRILIHIVNYLIKIWVVKIWRSWIIEHGLDLSHFETHILCCLLYYFVFCVKSVYYQLWRWVEISNLKIIWVWFLIF